MEGTARPASPIRGTCFGYEVRSELDFAYLRSGGGDPLEVAVEDGPPSPSGAPVKEWRPPRFPTHVRLYADGARYRLWIEDAGSFRVDPGASRLVVPAGGDPVRREERLWGLPMLLFFLARDDLPLHAAAVQVGGRAVILAAPRRAGKTTLAAAFAASGHRVLSEDLACVRRGPSPAVIPGPAMLRIRRDVADRLEVPGARELGRDEDRVHLSLESGRGDCDPVPVAGVAFLHEGDTDPRTERVETPQALRDLWALSFNLPRDEDRERSFRAVADLASRVPAWRLRRRLRVEDLRPAVERLVDAMDAAG